MTSHLVILGGGVCGLYAAHTARGLEAQVSLFEAASTFGGLAAGHQIDGNWFDLGVHMLHAFDEEVFETCRDAMGEERIEVPLKSHIKWNGKLYHYPLRGRDIIAGIPPLTLAHCLTGLFLAELQTRFSDHPPGNDAESALIELYGEPLYKFFFEDFTHRYWGLHPRALSAEFVRRKMPRLSAVDVFKNLAEKLGFGKKRDATEGALRLETLHYSRTGSEALPRRLARAVRDQGASLHPDSRVTSLSHKDEEIIGVSINGSPHDLGATHYLSTIPLPDLVKALDPPPPAEILTAAQSLRFKPMTVYALLLKKERCMEALYTYYRDRVFHRVGEPKNAGLEVTPKDHTTLIVEATCEVGDEKWCGEALPKILADLEAEGLCKPTDLVSHQLIHSRHAYPIFERGFEEAFDLVMNYLARFENLRTTGRQGGFTYPNMHRAMRMGATATQELLAP